MRASSSSLPWCVVNTGDVTVVRALPWSCDTFTSIVRTLDVCNWPVKSFAAESAPFNVTFLLTGTKM